MKNVGYALRNVLKINTRNLVKILSLTFGLIVATVFLSRVAFNQSFDSFHEDADRIYHVRADYVINGKSDSGDKVPDPVVPAMVKEFPEIECGTDLRYSIASMRSEYSDEKINLGLLITDTSFFEVFSFPDISGDFNRSSFLDTDEIFITEKSAKMLFKEENPIGKMVVWESGDNKIPFTVTKILKDHPLNSTIKFQGIISSERYSKRSDWFGGDRNVGYVKLKAGVDPEDINSRMLEFQGRNCDLDKMKELGLNVFYKIQHQYKLSSQSYGAIQMDMIMLLISLIVLIVSTSNYTLITLASLTTRAKAIGIHKSSGASSSDIRSMIFWETFFNVSMALLLSILLLTALRSQIESVIGIGFETLFSIENMWASFVVIAFVFIFSALLPALRFSKIEVTEIFRNVRNHSSFGKKILVFSQFALSLFVLSSLTVVMLQYNMLINRDLGYDKENIAYVRAGVFPDEQSMETLFHAILNDPAVETIALSDAHPTTGLSGSGVYGEADDMLFSSRVNEIDHRYIPLHSIKMLAGDNFLETNPYNHVIINRTVCELLNWEVSDAVGKSLKTDYMTATVIGVTEDFHVGNMYGAQQPLIMCYNGSLNENGINLSPTIIIKFREFTPLTISRINHIIQELTQNNQTELLSYNDMIRYNLGDSYMIIIGLLIAAIVILIITVMGVYGFVSDEVLRRMREIGVRKVFGSTSNEVIYMIQRKVLRYMIIAAPFGLGAGYFGSYYMINIFAYKIELSWWIFASVFVFLFAIIFLLVYMLVFKASRINPSETVK